MSHTGEPMQLGSSGALVRTGDAEVTDRQVYRIAAGTTLILLNGEPLINFVLTTV
jgi:hypothetical protein